MGVTGLMKYIIRYGNSCPITERIVGKTIRNTRVIYLDAISKLIEIYHQYMNDNVYPKTYESLFQYEVEKFTLYLIKISYYKRTVNVFIDYHFDDNVSVDDIIFREYLPDPTDEYKDKDENEWFNYLMKVKSREHKSELRKKCVESEIDGTYDDNIFRLLIHNINDFVFKLRGDPALADVTFYGCSIEADFAIAKHIVTYNKNVCPIVITTDTDLLALLCDVDCILKFSMGKHTYFVNPVEFWQKVFGTTLSPVVIKMLCIMKGVDYNIVDTGIKIYRFGDILGILHINSFDELTEDRLYAYICEYLEKNKDKPETQYTAIAINLYINDMESSFYEI